mmetsp:Transcript_40869/g.87190  ORF Transcript_40869/g.87190 Transcript_40869/m.87190 type:complete len:289 (+) Transcript_40869:305-1171(+)
MPTPPRISVATVARLSVAFVSAVSRSRAWRTAREGASARGRRESMLASKPHASWAEQLPSAACAWAEAAAVCSVLCLAAWAAASLASMAISIISAESTSSMISCKSACSLSTSWSLSAPATPCGSATRTIACSIIGTESSSSLSARATSPSSSRRSRSLRAAISADSAASSVSPSCASLTEPMRRMILALASSCLSALIISCPVLVSSALAAHARSRPAKVCLASSTHVFGQRADAANSSAPSQQSHTPSFTREAKTVERPAGLFSQTKSVSEHAPVLASSAPSAQSQ